MATGGTKGKSGARNSGAAKTVEKKEYNISENSLLQRAISNGVQTKTKDPMYSDATSKALMDEMISDIKGAPSQKAIEEIYDYAAKDPRLGTSHMIKILSAAKSRLKNIV